MNNLVLGTVQFGLSYGINNQTGRLNQDQVAELLNQAWELGVRELDTAQDYGDSEKVLAYCLSKTKKKFCIHSKFIDKNLPIQQSIELSLKNLGIDKLGYFYFHRFSDYLNCSSEKKSMIDTQTCLGLAVSVYDEDELSKVIGDKNIQAIQLPLNIFDCSQRKIELIQKAQGEGKKIFLRSLFLQGLFFMNPHDLPDKLKSFYEPLVRLHSIAQSQNISIRDLAFGFVNEKINKQNILIGVDTLLQLNENISSAQTKLNSQLIKELESIKILEPHLLLPKNWH